jgi:hypothetical protein
LRAAKASSPLDDLPSPCIVVGISQHDLNAFGRQLLDGLQRGHHLLGGLVELRRHRMLREKHHRAGQVQSQPRHDFFWWREAPLGNQVDGREAYGMDSPGFFSHGQDPVARLLVGCEVKVGQLGHCVPDRVVEGPAFSEVAAFDMSRRDVHLRRGDHGSQAFEPVRVDHHQVGSKSVQRLADRQHPGPYGLRGGEQGTCVHFDLDFVIDPEAVAANLFERAPEVAVEVCPRDDQAVLEVGMAIDCPQDRVLKPVLGPVARENGDSALSHDVEP